jgi:hypothetical protein
MYLRCFESAFVRTSAMTHLHRSHPFLITTGLERTSLLHRFDSSLIDKAFVPTDLDPSRLRLNAVNGDEGRRVLLLAGVKPLECQETLEYLAQSREFSPRR